MNFLLECRADDWNWVAILLRNLKYKLLLAVCRLLPLSKVSSVRRQAYLLLDGDPVALDRGVRLEADHAVDL